MILGLILGFILIGFMSYFGIMATNEMIEIGNKREEQNEINNQKNFI